MLIFFIFFKQAKVLLRYKETYHWGVMSISFLVGYLILGMGRPAFLDPVAIIVFASFQGMVQYEEDKIRKGIYYNLRITKEAKKARTMINNKVYE